MSGCLNVREVEARIDGQDMIEWSAYFALKAEDEKAAIDKAKNKAR